MYVSSRRAAPAPPSLLIQSLENAPCLPPEPPESALDRFLRYARIDTQSAEDQPQVPSTRKQLDLARLLVKELKGLGVKRVTLDAHGYVLATIPSNLPKGHPARRKVARVGLIAHLDTSPSAPGAGREAAGLHLPWRATSGCRGTGRW